MANQEDHASTDIDFAQELESLLAQHDYETPNVGDIREAVIVSISPQGIIVDLGLKRDGIIQPSDLDKLEPGEREKLEIDGVIPVYIQSTAEQDSLQVSLHMARMNEDWIRAKELLDSGEIVTTEIIGHNRGGALVRFGRLRGFVPASHLTFLHSGMGDQDRQRRMAQEHGEEIPVKVIEVDRHRRRLVLSNREAQRDWQEERRRELLEQLQVGDVVKGTVSGWREFGAFVDLGGADGLVHVSELAWHRVGHPREVVKMGEELDVYVLKVDRERERISLSRKKLQPNPWTLVDDNYSVGELVEGKIIRIVDYGAFVEVEPGVEGLLHTSQIGGNDVADPREVLKEGEIHLLRIISIDADRQRMGLSLRAVTTTEQIEWMTAREQDTQDAQASPQPSPSPEENGLGPSPVPESEENPPVPDLSEGDEPQVAESDVAEVVTGVAVETAAEDNAELAA